MYSIVKYNVNTCINIFELLQLLWLVTLFSFTRCLNNYMLKLVLYFDVQVTVHRDKFLQ